MFEIELLFQAENEFSDAFDWYQDKQFGLGNRLFNEVTHYLNLIQAIFKPDTGQSFSIRGKI